MKASAVFACFLCAAVSLAEAWQGAVGAAGAHSEEGPMTPAARVQAAIEILDQVQAGTVAERALTNWARKSRFAGSKDRAAIRDHVFDALRQRNSAGFLGGGSDGRALMLGVLRAKGETLEEVFSGAAYAPAALQAGEAIAPEGETPLDLPDWLIDPLQESLGAAFERTAEGMRHRAPIVLRVNLAKTSVTQAQHALEAEGILSAPMAMVETALEVMEGARRIKQSTAFLEGLVELQDGASQAMVAALPLRDGMKVLDYCAGGGGKSLAMAGRVPRATYFAHDADANRMQDIAPRSKRAGAKICLLNAPVEAAPFDLVLCDAPCSGSGTWRRTPDAKWRFTEEALRDLVAVQAEILDAAQALVKKGGALCYATCSFLRAENTDQIAAFMQRHPEFTLEWQRSYGFDDGGDGFFGAVLRRA